MVSIDKETLNRWINTENLSYIEISRRLDCSVNYVKKYALKLGINLPIRNRGKSTAWNTGLSKHIYTCKCCGKEFRAKYYKQFCSSSCHNQYKKDAKYKNYQEYPESFNGKEISYNWLKPIILKEQNNQCDICKMSPVWNEKELHFILDHIDGDACNNIRSNLRMICPNCDSQLDTYKSRNKGKSTRKYKPYRI